MSDLEKINIYVPEKIGNILVSDAKLFEIFKKDSQTVNRNRFLGMLIKGYYNYYAAKNKKIFDSILTEINSVAIAQDQKEQIAENILRNVILPEVPKRKGKHPTRLFLKPTVDTENLIILITNTIGGKDYISQYFCRIFMSYCDLALNEREQIIFKDNYDFLLRACNSGQVVTFSTIWNSKVVHEVIPYALIVGQDEMFNYLLCEEFIEHSGVSEARAYRLNRITKLNNSGSTSTLSALVRNHLDLMKYYGPQYAINDDEETCVKLSDAGVRSYIRIYYGRPQYDRIEKIQNEYFYYFKCSKEQLFLYFRRFGNKSAEILSPESLRQRMIDFHEKALDLYK